MNEHENISANQENQKPGAEDQSQVKPPSNPTDVSDTADNKLSAVKTPVASIDELHADSIPSDAAPAQDEVAQDWQTDISSREEQNDTTEAQHLETIEIAESEIQLSAPSNKPKVEEYASEPDTYHSETFKVENNSAEAPSTAAESAGIATNKVDEQVEIHDELIQAPAYNEMSREELLAAFKELARNDDFDAVKTRIDAIRDAYNYQKRDDDRRKKLRFLENGGEESAFESETDKTDVEFRELVAVYQARRAEFRKQKEKELESNLQQKQEILEQLRQLIEHNTGDRKSFDRLHELKDRWMKIGKVPPANTQNIWENFRFLCDKFYEIIKINNELRELDHKRNLELKTSLCEKAEALLLDDDLRRASQQFNELMQQWKETGQVAKDMSELIWDRFKRVGDSLHERRKQLIENLKESESQNAAIKTALIEKAEQMLAELPYKTHNEWQQASERWNVLLEEWKKTGFASKLENENLWNRFKNARNHFYNAKEDFYKALRAEQNHNYKLKNELCMEAEALRNSTDWKISAERIKALQEQWKSIGPVQKKFSDKLWHRFRNACDAFFAQRNAHFAGQNASQEENLLKKQALIEQIIAFDAKLHPETAVETLKQWQNEFMQIGHVPIKHKEEIYNRFRKAVDQQFNKLRELGVETRKQVFKAQIETLKSLPDASGKINAKRQELMEKIRKIQNDVGIWENNIGFLGRSKGADALKKEVEQKIDKARKEVQMLKAQLAVIDQEK